MRRLFGRGRKEREEEEKEEVCSLAATPTPVPPPPPATAKSARVILGKNAAGRSGGGGSSHRGSRHVRRTASQSALNALSFALGAEVWYESETDGGRMWSRGEVVAHNGAVVVVQQVQTTDDPEEKEEREVNLEFQELHLCNAGPPVADMTALHHIHEPGILYNLEARYMHGPTLPQAYTFMANILLAVNPLQPIPVPDIALFAERPLDPECPHPFAIAELAYQQMKLEAQRKVSLAAAGVSSEEEDNARRRINQSIVISGESGAGKTETAKIVLRYLTNRAGASETNIDQKLIDSSPLMESFGNAKTLRNANSSRFGKLMKLQFVPEGAKGEHMRLSGAFIETYLLEKSRVANQLSDERNYHIFYQLLAGASPGFRRSAELLAPERYHYLNRSGCVAVDGVDDAAGFARVCEALNTVGIGHGARGQDEIFRVIAAILALGNIEFAEHDTDEGQRARIIDPTQQLAQVARLLALTDPEPLAGLMTHRTTKIASETHKIRLTVQDAVFARDSLARALYGALFDWLVAAIDASVGRGDDDRAFIGVLDIFGFESFTANGFEQLLINFANEALATTFNNQVFVAELALFADEGIDCPSGISCPNNSECVELLTASPNGVLTLMDNLCNLPTLPADTKYLSDIQRLHARNHAFPKIHPKDKKDSFHVKHFAQRVKYTVGGWLEKNMDKVPGESSAVFAAAAGIVGQLNIGGLAGGGGGGGGGGGRKKTKKPTISKKFVTSMKSLNDALAATRCAFVRCVKPNAEMETGRFEPLFVIEQLRALGLLQTCEVLKVGLPTRVRYSDLRASLSGLPRAATELFQGEPEETLISAVLWAFDVPADAYRLGRSRVFFKAGMIAKLGEILAVDMDEQGEWLLSRLQESIDAKRRAVEASGAANDSADAAQAAAVRVQKLAAELSVSGATLAASAAASIASAAGSVDAAKLAAEAASEASKSSQRLAQEARQAQVNIRVAMAARMVQGAADSSEAAAEEATKHAERAAAAVQTAREAARAARTAADGAAQSRAAGVASAASAAEEASKRSREAASRSTDAAARCQQGLAEMKSKEAADACAAAEEKLADAEALVASCQKSAGGEAAQVDAASSAARSAEDAKDGALSAFQDAKKHHQSAITFSRAAEAAASAMEQQEREMEEEEAAERARIEEEERVEREREYTERQEALKARQKRLDSLGSRKSELVAAGGGGGGAWWARSEKKVTALHDLMAESDGDSSRELIAAPQATSDLPMGWFEDRDLASGRTYYRCATGAVQWKLPTPDMSLDADILRRIAERGGGDASEDEVSEDEIEDDDALPSGWREFFAKDEKTPFWQNKITGGTQWERPSSPAQSRPGQHGLVDDGAATVAAPLPETREEGGMSTEELMMRKEGYLMIEYDGDEDGNVYTATKFFVLEDDYMECFKNKSAANGTSEDTLDLHPGTMTGYHDGCSFQVQSGEFCWTLSAMSEEETDDWIQRIAARVVAIVDAEQQQQQQQPPPSSSPGGQDLEERQGSEDDGEEQEAKAAEAAEVWISVFDERKAKDYYVHKLTNRTTWKKPSGANVQIIKHKG